MTAIQNLGNTVIANAASRSLAKYVCRTVMPYESPNKKNRFKSRAEYRDVFSSPKMFFRALHTISTQRYRLPVRRYIIDLFNIELDSDLVAKLDECAKALKAPPSLRPVNGAKGGVTLIKGLGRSRRGSESADEDDELDTRETKNGFVEEPPVISMPALSKTIGFAI